MSTPQDAREARNELEDAISYAESHGVSVVLLVLRVEDAKDLLAALSSPAAAGGEPDHRVLADRLAELRRQGSRDEVYEPVDLDLLDDVVAALRNLPTAAEGEQPVAYVSQEQLDRVERARAADPSAFGAYTIPVCSHKSIGTWPMHDPYAEPVIPLYRRPAAPAGVEEALEQMKWASAVLHDCVRKYGIMDPWKRLADFDAAIARLAALRPADQGDQP